MSREFKFKAFDLLNNKTTSTNISIDFDACMCHLLDEEFKGNPTFITDFIPLQFTGLLDKNGVEIYEGDILKSVTEVIALFSHKPNTGKIRTTYRVVEYRNSCSAFCIVGDSLSGIYQTIASKFYEVIGNIYENPELLEESKE